MKLTPEQQKEISELYAEQFVPLLCYARTILQDRDAAEEAVQETFRIACGKAEKLLASENRDGWLMNTLKNILRNRKKLYRRFLRIFTPMPPDEELEMHTEPPGELDIMIRSLLTREEYALYREVIVGGESLTVTARRHGITMEACKKRVQRIRARLRESLRDCTEQTADREGREDHG